MENINDIRAVLAANGYTVTEQKEISYGIQLRVEDAGTIRLYTNTKGKTRLDLSQLKDDELRTLLGAPSGGYPLLAPPLCGSDEAGKGDWFGPLVVACVYCDEKMYPLLASAGVRDSKELSDAKTDSLRDAIIKICPVYTVIEISPEVFNRTYAATPNMNTILERAHAQAVRKTSEKSGCRRVLIDQFTSAEKMEKALSGTGISLTLAHRAEENLCVAAASILARSVYKKRLGELSERYGIGFPAGAGPAADDAARQFVSLRGEDELAKVCKLNFKNTQKVTSNGSC